MVRHVRTLFISDLHLGTRGCQAAALLSFLKTVEADQIYLVGDIVDGWRLKQSWYWPQLHNDVVQKLLRRARKGNRVILVPGNHDEFLRDYVGSNFGGVEIMEEAIHETANGRRILILHGDKFDTVVRNVKWLALLGDWSFSAYAKQKVKRAVSFISAFEEAVVADAERHDVDAVLCGHIHQACIRRMRNIEYINTGDWVESCTAVLEHLDGRLELVHWTSHEVDAIPVQAEVLRPAA